MDYSGRRITNVQVSGLQRHEHFDDSTISGSVRFQLSAHDGDEFGPSATVDLTVDLADGSTIQEVENQFLTAAIAVLARLTSLSSNDALCELPQNQPKRYLPKAP